VAARAKAHAPLRHSKVERFLAGRIGPGTGSAASGLYLSNSIFSASRQEFFISPIIFCNSVLFLFTIDL
jgi:hypothetical protein